MALANAGFIVDAVCPAGHPLDKMKAVRQTHAYRGLAPMSSFADAIAASKPDCVIPGDDLATSHLHRLHDRAREQGEAGQPIRDLIELSLGAAESFSVVCERSRFMDIARKEGIRAPKTTAIENREELREWLAGNGFPAVLKANGTSGGDGVRIAHTMDEAERAFRALQAPPLLARAAKRALADQDRTLVWPSVLRHRPVVNGQVFVGGREATSTVACWQGNVLASLHFEMVHKLDSSGPSSVLRLTENPEMAAATEKMARRLNLSGLHGFDFMLEGETGSAHLIEINPRATQIGHLALGPGRDLPAALYSAFSGEPVHAAPKVTENDTITLFPQEWMRDPASSFLASGYHDVPWEEPELLRACVRKRSKTTFRLSAENSAQTLSTAQLPPTIRTN
jgi:hypothetical protein